MRTHHKEETMKFDRRRFLGAAAGSLSLPLLSDAQEAVARGLTKADLPTPALLLDLGLFESNLKTLADHCKAAGRNFRPHAKTHKCPQIARRQVASGAVGVCVATVSEAEAMVAAGIRGVLLTSPIVERHKIDRMARLARSEGAVLLSVGHALEVAGLQAAGVAFDVLVDLDVGDRRTGIPPAGAVDLARQIAAAKNLTLRGIQAYAGHASHTTGFDAREKTSRDAMAKAHEVRDQLAKAGIEAPILSGGSTGTYNIDTGTPGVTELQAGSYVFMDVDYRRIGGRGGAVYADFHPSLTVLSTVVSASHADRVSIDAGTKALDTTVAWKPEAKGRAGLSYGRGGDEFGILAAEEGAKLPAIGDRLEFIVPHCDPTTNLYDRVYVTNGEKVVDVWPILARRESGPAR
jgi:D-serine deaminase-like pyridoxal phosphate-dependent protein